MSKTFDKFLKQAQKMQEQMMSMQDQMGEVKVEGSAGGGMVIAVMNGKQELVSIKIKPEVVNAQETELLEDLIVAAVHQAHEKAQALQQKEIGQITGGLKIPGLGA